MMELEEYRRMAAMEDHHWWYPATRALLDDLMGSYLAGGGRMLDAGGGTGATGAWMGEYGDLVVADFQPAGLMLYGEAHPKAERVAADISHLPFADDSFAAALCVTVLYHRSVTSPAIPMAELARVVRPGGVVCVLEPGVRRLFRAHDRYNHGARRFSRRDLRRLAEGAGLEVRRATGAHSFLVPPAAVKAVLERRRSDHSDLDTQPGGLGGVLSAFAKAERAVLRRVNLPFGLSVAVVATKPTT